VFFIDHQIFNFFSFGSKTQYAQNY
jgi:hypothetical protein